MADTNLNEDMRWCYLLSTPYNLESLGDDAWLTGCPLCGENCWDHATAAQKEEANQYYSSIHNDKHEAGIATWNAALDAVLDEIGNMLFQPEAHHHNLNNPTLVAVAYKVHSLRKQPNNNINND